MYPVFLPAQPSSMSISKCDYQTHNFSSHNKTTSNLLVSFSLSLSLRLIIHRPIYFMFTLFSNRKHKDRECVWSVLFLSSNKQHTPLAWIPKTCYPFFRHRLRFFSISNETLHKAVVQVNLIIFFIFYYRTLEFRIFLFNFDSNERFRLYLEIVTSWILY